MDFHPLASVVAIQWLYMFHLNNYFWKSIMGEGEFDVVEFNIVGYVGEKIVKSLENRSFDVCGTS